MASEEQSGLILPSKAFVLYKSDNAIFFPKVPIHPAVKSYSGEVSGIHEEFDRLVEEGMNGLYDPETAERYLGFVRAKGVIPKVGGFGKNKPYLMNGVFNINCDSVETNYFMPYENYIDEIGEENASLLNALVEQYKDERGEVTLVFSHNARAETADPVLHKAWAIAVNNKTLEHLIKEGKL